LNDGPDLLLPACTRLISAILPVLELFHHDRVINIGPDTTPDACIRVVLLLCIGILLLRGIEGISKER
jgi:hypothetical protein